MYFLYDLFQALHRELNSCIALGVSAIQLYIHIALES